MNRYSRIAIFGFLVWLVPFLISFLIFPLHAANRPLFESVMPVAIAACAVFFSIIYLRRLQSGFFREGVLLGIVWLAISIALDLPLFLAGPMKMSLPDYVMDIGLTYLIIPVTTSGLGYALEAVSSRGGHKEECE